MSFSFELVAAPMTNVLLLFICELNKKKTRINSNYKYAKTTIACAHMIECKGSENSLL